MSFLDDLWDAVKAPFEVIPGFVSDLAHGKNFFESVGKASVAGYAATDGGKSLIVSSDFGKKISSALDAPTFGIAGDVQKRAELIKRINAGGSASTSEIKRELLIEGRNAAIVYGGSVAAGAAPAGASATTTAGYSYLGGKATAGLIKSKDPGAALSLFGASMGVPDGLVDGANYLNELYKQYKPGEVKFVGSPTIEGYGSNDSGYGNGPSGPPVAAIAAVGILVAALAYKAVRK